MKYAKKAAINYPKALGALMALTYTGKDRKIISDKIKMYHAIFTKQGGITSMGSYLDMRGAETQIKRDLKMQKLSGLKKATS